jgi:hypothetical protein
LTHATIKVQSSRIPARANSVPPTNSVKRKECGKMVFSIALKLFLSAESTKEAQLSLRPEKVVGLFRQFGGLDAVSE